MRYVLTVLVLLFLGCSSPPSSSHEARDMAVQDQAVLDPRAMADRYLPPILDSGVQNAMDAKVTAASDASGLESAQDMTHADAQPPAGDAAEPTQPDVNAPILDANPPTVDASDGHASLLDADIEPEDQGVLPADMFIPPVDAHLPRCGDGLVEGEEECDDGNADNRDRCQNDCTFNQPCAVINGPCPDRDNYAPRLREHRMARTDQCRFELNAPSDEDWARGFARIQQLEEAIGNSQDISSILDDLNREGRNGITNQAATRLRNHDYSGFVWNNGDMDVSYWYPQGITGGSDAYADGLLNRRRVFMVSWYHRTDERPTKGARVSLIDYTDRQNIRYRHLLLVEPVPVPNGIQFKSVEYDHGDNDALHAGGIVWLGPYLYVADTRVGMRVFDMTRIMRVSHSDDTDRIGFRGNRSDAHGYRYMIPQIARYELSDRSCPLSFSAIGLDRSTIPPTILSAEYRSDDIQSRLVKWPVDLDSARLLDIDGTVQSWGAVMAAQEKIQGALTWEDNYYISSSSQFGMFGRLYRTRPGRESNRSAWVYGCEDLYYERATGLIWTAAEYPDFRDVVGIPLRIPEVD